MISSKISSINVPLRHQLVHVEEHWLRRTKTSSASTFKTPTTFLEIESEMTPDQCKKPLPSSTTILFLEHPQTPYEWRYAIKVIKVEHQKGQWTQCLKRCNRMLNARCPPIPLHTACLHFYAALSEEAIARQMHDMSLAKIRAFQHTKTRFEQAASALPSPPKDDKDDESLSPDSESDVDDTVSLEDSVSSVGGSHPCSVPSSPMSKHFEEQISPSHTLRPLPLHICKVRPQSSNSFQEKKAFFESRLQVSMSSPPMSPTPKSPALNKPLPTPPSLRARIQEPSDPRLKPALQPACAITGVQSEAQERYNDQLLEFAQMLIKHIHFVDEAILKAQEAQASGRRRLFKERKNSADQGEEESLDLKTRIVNLKKRGWISDRFVPARYQELCERALAEL